MIETVAVLAGLIVITIVVVAVLRRWAERPDSWESRIDKVIEKPDKPEPEPSKDKKP